MIDQKIIENFLKIIEEELIPAMGCTEPIALAYAAAASEARMDGCDMPVIINSGSGNQGIASSVPIIVYAREKIFHRKRCIVLLCFLVCLLLIRRSL